MDKPKRLFMYSATGSKYVVTFSPGGMQLSGDAPATETTAGIDPEESYQLIQIVPFPPRLGEVVRLVYKPDPDNKPEEYRVKTTNLLRAIRYEGSAPEDDEED